MHIGRIALIASAGAVSLSLLLAQGGTAQEKKDMMGKDATMKGEMKKDTMTKGEMKKDEMPNDSMKKDKMMKEEMKK